MESDGDVSFVNTNGVLINKVSLDRNITTESDQNIDGEDVGKIIFTVASKKAELLEP